MKSLTSVYVLAAVATLLLAASLIVSYLENEGFSAQPNEVVSGEAVGWDGEEVYAVVNGMRVVYQMAAIDESTEDVVEVSSLYNSDSETCEIQIASNYMEKNSPVFEILGSLANCYGQSQLGFPTDNLDNDYNFINTWIRLYVERCDRRLEPLGFPAQDGQCEVPRFASVLDAPILN